MTDPATNSVLSTTLTVAVSANTLFNLALGWVTWSLRSSAARVTRLEDKLEKAESARDAKQHELTDKLIDARLRDFTHQLGQLMQKAQTTSDAQEKFIEQAERKMEALGQRGTSRPSCGRWGRSRTCRSRSPRTRSPRTT